MTAAGDSPATQRPNARWPERPEGSNWGDFGAADQAGRLNLITPEVVRRAVAEVREGLTFCLSLPLDFPGGTTFSPGRLPPALAPTDRRGKPFFLYAMEQEAPGAGDVVNDDEARLTLQYSTHWDALCHIGYRRRAADGTTADVFYNGFLGGVDIVPPDAEGRGVKALGIEVMAARAVQTRGVLIDLHAHFGEARRAVGYDDLMQVLSADGIEVAPGDILCINTGFGRALMEMGGAPDAARLRASFPAFDGRDRRLLDWIGDSGVAAIAADNHAVELTPALPSDEPGAAFFPLHEHCLFRLGIHLGEFWFLADLAAWLRARGRSHFLLTAPPLRLRGAVGSPLTPVATV